MDIFSTQYARWHQFFEGLSVSPLDFYGKLEARLEERKVPEITVRHIELVMNSGVTNRPKPHIWPVCRGVRPIHNHLPKNLRQLAKTALVGQK